MQDRLALMLDSMIFAVDNGHSFDGIVSVPQIGLEDWGHRPGMTGWLDEGAELLRTIIPRFFHRPSPRVIPVKYDKHSRERDSGIASGDEFFGGRDPATPLSPGWKEILPTDKEKRSDDDAEEGEKDGDRPREEKAAEAGDRGPRLKVGPSPSETLPRRKRTILSGGQRSLWESVQAVENIAQLHIAHSSSTGPGNEGDIRRPSNLETGKEPRLKRND